MHEIVAEIKFMHENKYYNNYDNGNNKTYVKFRFRLMYA